MNIKDLSIFFDEEIKALGETNLPDPDTLDYYKRLQNREVLWNSDIDDYLATLTMQIIQWNREDKDIPVEQRKPIKIFISSDGGHVDPTLNIIDVIGLSKTPVYTIALSRAYSSGGLLLMAGHKRYIFSNTSFLLHDGGMGAMGDTAKVMDRIEFNKKVEKKIKEYVLSKSKLDNKTYDRNWRKDWFLLSDEIIKYGFADKIITDLDEIL